MVPDLPSPKRQQAIEDASAIADALAGAWVEFKIRDNRGRPLAAACLAATICESLYAAVAIVLSRGQSHAKTIARGMIDAGVNLEITCNGTDSDYEALRLATALGFLRFAGQYLDGSSYDIDAVDRAEFDKKRLSELANVDLKQRGVKPLEMKDKFAKAPKMNAFSAYYALYCSDAHNDHRTLAERHLRSDHIALCYPIIDSDVAHVLTVCCGVALKVFDFMPFYMKVTAKQLHPTWMPLTIKLRRIAGQGA